MSGPVELAGDRPSRMHQHPMANGRSPRCPRSRTGPPSPGGELGHQAVDVLLGGDVDAAGDVVQQQDLRVGQAAIDRAGLLLVSAAERAHRLARPRASIAEPLIMPSATCVSPDGLKPPAAASRFRMGRVRFSLTVIGSSSPSRLAVLGHERDARLDRVARAVQAHALPARPGSRPRPAVTPNRAWKSSRWPCPSRPPMPTISPACTAKVTRRSSRAPQVAASSIRRRGAAAAQRTAVDSSTSTGHQPDRLVLGQLIAGLDLGAAAEYRDPVGEVCHLPPAVRGEHHARTIVAEPAHQAK